MVRNTTSDPTDDQLMRQVAAGDPDAYGVLVRRHQRIAWSVAVRYTGRREDAADLVQESFLAVLESAPRYRPQGQFRAYLLRILVHRAISDTRKKSPLLLEEADQIPDPDAGEADLDLASRKARLRGLLDQLPTRQRMALVLRFYEELSYREIARIMETSEKTVERLLHRGRDTLRKAMRQAPEGDR
jgi:RNA polymerase sigma-70 factor, ECF subfamily